MNILWCSARNLGTDLSGTTQSELCKSIVELGNHVRLVSPGSSESDRFEHVRIPRWDVPGFHALTAANSMKSLWPELLEGRSVIIIDWQLAPMLAPKVPDVIPWFLMDRSPPAYSGMLARFQRRVWKSAWRLASSAASGGFTVSVGHTRMVRRLTGAQMNIQHVPAGVDGTRYRTMEENEDERLKIVYHGRLDRNRAVLDLIEMKAMLDSYGIENTLSLAGYGDVVKKLQRHASEREGIEILGKLEPRDVPGLLAGHHIGMLPMPRTEIWSIASPLKLVEYAAAGLHVVGIDHEGHRWEGQEDWLHLIEGGRGWIERAARTIMMLHRGGLERSKQAQAAAATRTWAASAQRMLDAMA